MFLHHSHLLIHDLSIHATAVSLPAVGSRLSWVRSSTPGRLLQCSGPPGRRARCTCACEVEASSVPGPYRSSLLSNQCRRVFLPTAGSAPSKRVGGLAFGLPYGWRQLAARAKPGRVSNQADRARAEALP